MIESRLNRGNIRNSALIGVVAAALAYAAYDSGKKEVKSWVLNPSKMIEESAVNRAGSKNVFCEELERMVDSIHKKKKNATGFDWPSVSKDIREALFFYNISQISADPEALSRERDAIGTLPIDAFLEYGEDQFFVPGYGEVEVIDRKYGDKSLVVTYRTMEIGGEWSSAREINIRGIDYTLKDLFN